ncbi:hypothetical protein B0H14DRAFT_420945 [Mycena olivaceomarginata]|nr:hypothetical protein B0H14DRAFT_420945 [Mycena olivaceomarginata]
MCSLLLLRSPRMHESAHVWEGQGFHCRHSMPCSMRNNGTWRHWVAQHPARSSTTPSVPWRPHQRTTRAPDDRHTRPPRAEPKPRHLYRSLHYVISIHVSISPHIASPPTRFGSSNPSPPNQRRFSPANYNTSPKRSTRGQNTHVAYNELVVSPRPPRPAHIHRRVLAHVPPRAITILRPKPSPRAGDCAPGEDVAQAQNCVDGCRVTGEKSRGGARVMHYVRRVWTKQSRENRMLVEMGRALFHRASAALDGSPKRYRAVTGSRANPITNGACRIRSPSPLSRTTYISLLRLPRPESSLYMS